MKHAYALVQDPVTGKHFAVHLENVLFERATYLEPSKRAEHATKGIMRIERAIQVRHFKKEW